MKIIDIAICIDNIDPMGIGRIRCVRYNDYISEKHKSISYVPWSDRDPYVASPFLPTNINLIPKISQSVKVLNYNTAKETVNQEYISGPFTTMYDYNTQTFSQQTEYTTYGESSKKRNEIRNKSGQYIEKNSDILFAKDNDYAIYGKYGSDIVFTENGINLRGGKLIAKDTATTDKRLKLVDYPIYSPKISKLQLKKFPFTATLKDSTVTTITNTPTYVKTLVEYEFDNVNNPTYVNFYVYNITKQSDTAYYTDNFSASTVLLTNDAKLINVENNNISATHTIVATGFTKSSEISSAIRRTINDISTKDLSYLNTLYSNDDLHPLYFRPTKNLITMSGETSEMLLKETILNDVYVKTVIRNGLIFSKQNVREKLNTKEVKLKDFVIDNNSPEQTFGSLSADKLFLLTTDMSQNKNVNFDDLNKYEYTQEDYIKKLEPSTYSLVRGETLLLCLKALTEVLFKHKHNVIDPYVKEGFDEHIQLLNLYKNLENDILNKSIKIN